jgi:hypothetical protein
MLVSVLRPIARLIRSSTAAKMARVRFPVARTRDKSAAWAYVAIVPDERFPGMYRLKRTDGSLSDMVNLTRAKDALAAMRGAGNEQR